MRNWFNWGVTDIGLCWTTLTWQLQDQYDIYILDTCGHGLSDLLTASDDSEILIKDVISSVKVKKIEKPVLIGHSMGAATVMHLVTEYPVILQKRSLCPTPVFPANLRENVLLLLLPAGQERR
jgi:pimeloyl-ACP methyl ester carboxylesterase